MRMDPKQLRIYAVTDKSWLKPGETLEQVVEELLLMRKEYHTAMILVTHNIGVVRKMADRILVLKNGLVRDYGETEKVLDHSQDAYTQKLMNSVLHLKRDAE